MYTHYFGFQEEPFSLTPTSRLFYSNPVYEGAYTNLLEGIRERRGFMALLGEVGTGKTTLIRRLISNLNSDPTVRFCFSYYSTLSFEELIDFVCEDLGVTIENGGAAEKASALIEFLTRRAQEGGITVLVIDEAQDLDEEVLEQLSRLLHTQPSREKVLQVILVGQQPELDAKLGQPRLSRLKRRISIWSQIERLEAEEIQAFIHCRLRLVGYQRQDLFPPEVIQLIARYSQGIPRLINLICDNAFRIAYESAKKTISTDIIHEVARTLRVGPAKARAIATSAGAARSSKALATNDHSTSGVSIATSRVQTKPARHLPSPLVWASVGCLVTLLGFFVFSFTFKGVQGEKVRTTSGTEAIVELDPQIPDQHLIPFDEQQKTLVTSSDLKSPSARLKSTKHQSALLGKAVFEKLQQRHRNLRSIVWGLATGKPAIALLIPAIEWGKLSQADQVSLSLYLESSIPAVRADPDPYIAEFRHTSLYEPFRVKLGHLCADCWVLGVGRLTANGESVLFDKVIVQGDSLWEDAPSENRGTKASEFWAERLASP